MIRYLSLDWIEALSNEVAGSDVLRSIGDPKVRFVEDPVRMLRAAVFAARLGFDMDPEVIEALALHRKLIMKASSARMMEEYFKILRSGYAESSFRALSRVRLLERRPLLQELGGHVVEGGGEPADLVLGRRLDPLVQLAARDGRGPCGELLDRPADPPRE